MQNGKGSPFSATDTAALAGQIPSVTFADYARDWMAWHVRPYLKHSTIESYRLILEHHLLPRFAALPLECVTRAVVKEYLGELIVDGKRAGNTVRNILATLRAIYAEALEDGLVSGNPAEHLGRRSRPALQTRQAEFLTREETERFLVAAKELRPERYPLFLAAVRTGLRAGELVALEWDDIHFGASEVDRNRYILIWRNFTHGQLTTPKNGKMRRVDLSRELRRVLLELQERRISRLVFPSRTGGPLNWSTFYRTNFLPLVRAAGLQRVTFHALRHTFASLLIQNGASLAYVKDQLGHSSIRVTVDIYGHLVPGGNVEWVDRLDAVAEAGRLPATP